MSVGGYKQSGGEKALNQGPNTSLPPSATKGFLIARHTGTMCFYVRWLRVLASYRSWSGGGPRRRDASMFSAVLQSMWYPLPHRPS